MPIDPNVYALSIELQLNAQKAYDDLDTLGESLIETEHKISQAATKAFQNISVLTTNINESLSAINNISNSFRMNMQTITNSYGETNDITDETYQLQIKQFKQLLKEEKIIKNLHKMQDKDLKNHKVEIKDLRKIFSSVQDIDKAVRKKNVSHAEESDHVEREIGLLKTTNEETNKKGRGLKSLKGVWLALTSTLSGVVKYLEMIDKGAENFITANYRLYGSQVYLLQASRAISAEYGVTTESAIAAMKAMANVKTPQEELLKLAGTVAAMNRVTGISIQSLAQYTKALRAAGIEGNNARKQLILLAEAMKKYGISAEDAAKITSINNNSLIKMKAMLGGSNAELERFTKFRAAMVGMAQGIGFTADQALKLTDSLADPIVMLKLRNFAGGVGKGMDGIASTLMRTGKQFDELSQKIAAAENEDAKREMLIKYAKQAEAIGLTEESARLLEATYRDLRKELDTLGKSLDDAAAVEEALVKIQNDYLAESNNNLFAQLRIMREYIGNIFGPALEFVADGLKYFVMIINSILRPIASAVAGFFAWIEKLQQTNSALASVIIGIKIAVAGVVVFFSILLGLIGLFGAFNIIAFVGNIFRNGAIMIGDAIAEIGERTRNVILPLLGLATAFAIAGVGAYLFASAVQIVANSGENAIWVLWNMAAALAVLGLAFVGLGFLASNPLVGGGILIVAAAMLALGAAAMMAGYGVKLFGEGLISMSDAISAGIIWQLPLLAGAISAFALTIALAVPVLLGAGLAFIMIGTGLVIAAAGLNMLLVAMRGLESLNMINSSTNLLIASGILLAAGAILTLASGWLLQSSIALLPATAMLLISSAVLGAASAIMIAGAAALGIGSTIVLISAIMLGVAAAIMFPASIALLASVLIMGVAAIAMGIAGAALTLGSIALAIGLAALGLAIVGFGRRANILYSISNSLNVFANALMGLSAIEVGNIRGIISEITNSFDELSNLPGKIDIAATQLNTAISKFEDPANRLADILDRLNETISGFASGFNLGDNIGTLATQLDQYVALLENAAERIAVAIETKAVPAMRAAEEAGIQETLRSEAVNTVKVMNEEESDRSVDQGMVDIATAQLDMLGQLYEALISMTGGDSTVKDIFDILQQYLPKATKKQSSLSVEFNSWDK